ncbi:recombination-associated protein RdgC [Pantoea sp. LMR881]|uniref:recombination-associated protein RdgC n=1 Tax=Pantoea sp. LMR881 TaxID=3014336 RepID=UPI0022AEA7FA|nr:recombination-associated protein RdgC [Pantoea sp. LMR881]MCZ4061162.1 recombination-associated protein RdgC [Pantoea sp. LMR881]
MTSPEKTEKDTLKDEVLHTLLPRAFTRNSFIQIWIDLERLRIVIDTTSPRNAENALALLRKSIGSLPVVPIMTVNPPALELTDWIKQQRAPVPFEMGESTSAKVMSILESGATATFKKEPVGSETLESSLSDGRLVCSLAICHAGEFLTEVTLTDDLIFKRIEFPDAFKDRNEDIAVDEDADKLARAEADFILMCDTLAPLSLMLWKRLGAKVKPVGSHLFKLTAKQQEAINATRRDKGADMTGMLKWNVSFACGKGCTMLSDQCVNREEAIYAAVERFGSKVINVS